MFKIFQFFLLYVFVSQTIHIQAQTQDENDLKSALYVKIFELQSVTSYYECEKLADFFNEAHQLNIPVDGIPLQPITEREVSFVTYSRQHADKPLVADTYDVARSVQNLQIDFKLPNVFFVHGLHRTIDEFVPIFKNLLPKQNINIFIMDWDTYCRYNSMYSRGITAPRLGNILAKFLQQCIAAGANPANIFLIGVSSGAQAVGLAGQQIQPKIGRILAIDPVGPCYNFVPDSQRVSAGDADFVQVVHCSIGAYGELSKLLGDATFYMNGGKIQPQCLNEKTLDGVNKCSHDSCANYVFETFEHFQKYIGVSCDSYEKYMSKECNCTDRAVMGYDTSTNTRGAYYVDTASNDEPICKTYS